MACLWILYNTVIKTKSQHELRVYWEMFVLCSAYPNHKHLPFSLTHKLGKNQIKKPLFSKIKDEAHEGLNTPFSCLELRGWDLDVLIPFLRNQG